MKTKKTPFGSETAPALRGRNFRKKKKMIIIIIIIPHERKNIYETRRRVLQACINYSEIP